MWPRPKETDAPRECAFNVKMAPTDCIKSFWTPTYTNVQGAFAAPHALALFFTTNIPYICRSKQLAHCAPIYYTKGKKFFLHLTLFSSFALITNKLHSVRWFQNILHYLTPHLTLSYTASYTILHCILHPHLSLYKYAIGRRTRSNGHTECGHRGSGKSDAPTDFSASRWRAAALAQRVFPSAWHLVCKRCVRWFFIILHCVTI